MTIEQAFNELLSGWDTLPPEFKEKYFTYRSKYLISQKDPSREKIGVGKIIEMLENAVIEKNKGYEVSVKKVRKKIK